MSTTEEASSLDKLHDIIIPDAVSLWPLADGWPVLFFVLVTYLWVGLFFQYRRYQSNQYRRNAMQALAQINKLENPHEKIIKLFDLLKRTALSCYPRHQVAPLSGTAWWDFLQQSSGVLFSQASQNFCSQALYQPNQAKRLANQDPSEAQKQANLFLTEVRQWIKQHKKMNTPHV